MMLGMQGKDRADINKGDWKGIKDEVIHYLGLHQTDEAWDDIDQENFRLVTILIQRAMREQRRVMSLQNSIEKSLQPNGGGERPAPSAPSPKTFGKATKKTELLYSPFSMELGGDVPDSTFTQALLRFENEGERESWQTFVKAMTRHTMVPAELTKHADHMLREERKRYQVIAEE